MGVVNWRPNMNRLTLSFYLLACLVPILATTGCTTVPVTGRHELNFISSDQEMTLGLSSFDQLKKDTPINHDPSINAVVERVGRRIAAVAGKDLPNAQWEFVVFESKEANAFCLPGGKVGVYTGLLPITRDDAGLATVLGHEIGHAVAHHGASRMSQEEVVQAFGKAVDAGASGTDPKVHSAVLSRTAWGQKWVWNFRIAARRNPKPTTSAWSTCLERVMTPNKPWRSGSVC